MDTIREFDSVWKKFMVMCRAKLMEKSKQCALSGAAAEMSVQDAASMWFDPYDACGQWLKRLEKDKPQAAKKVRTILQEIKLEEVPAKLQKQVNKRPLANKATYKVRKGDTLFSIASSANMSVNQLKKLNGIRNNNLKVGQTLKLAQ